ncbi:MAG TPA: hypothetical protein PKE29_13400 [Phycisphaerales bacterium]|nr:hypothetical protein [Phycisphaerales bacterium]
MSASRHKLSLVAAARAVIDGQEAELDALMRDHPAVFTASIDGVLARLTAGELDHLLTPNERAITRAALNFLHMVAQTRRAERIVSAGES